MEKVREVLSKDSLNSEDINFLIANKNLLSQDDLVRLGLAPMAPILEVKEPVTTVTEETEISQVIVEEPKKRGRPKKL